MDNDDAQGNLPLTPATALQFSGLIPQRTNVPQATVTEDGIIVPAAVPILDELHQEYGVREAAD